MYKERAQVPDPVTIVIAFFGIKILKKSITD